jgi:hypothetical protein
MYHAWGKGTCTEFSSENVKGREHFGDLGINGRKILFYLREIGYEEMKEIQLTHDRVQ